MNERERLTAKERFGWIGMSFLTPFLGLIISDLSHKWSPYVLIKGFYNWQFWIFMAVLSWITYLAFWPVIRFTILRKIVFFCCLAWWFAFFEGFCRITTR